MTTAELLKSLEDAGTLKQLLKKGLISSQVIHQREIYYRVLVHINDLKNPRMTISQAVSNAADDLNIVESRVWRAWSAMTK